MKILRNFALASVAIIAVSCSNTGEAIQATEAQEVATPEESAVSYAVQTDGDEIAWVGFKTISGDQHHGTIQVTEGEMNVQDGKLVGGTFVIDMNSIYNIDVPMEGEYNKEKLTNHLKSDAFFDVANHPTATFTITGVVEGADGMHNISGNLKMRGKENNITFPANVSITENGINFEAPEFTIDRTQWDVMFLSANLVDVAKDRAIDNNIKLEVTLSATK